MSDCFVNRGRVMIGEGGGGGGGSVKKENPLKGDNVN